ncbi:hypothetical protein ABTQ23_12960 [Celerinatantimonas sp. MCCC 1A17872]
MMRSLQSCDFDWVFLSPSAMFVHGPRSGKFRLGKDERLVGDDGSKITFEEYAIALANEIEKPKYHQERFIVGY